MLLSLFRLRGERYRIRSYSSPSKMFGFVDLAVRNPGVPCFPYDSTPGAFPLPLNQAVPRGVPRQSREGCFRLNILRTGRFFRTTFRSTPLPDPSPIPPLGETHASPHLSCFPKISLSPSCIQGCSTPKFPVRALDGSPLVFCDLNIYICPTQEFKGNSSSAAPVVKVMPPPPPR